METKKDKRVTKFAVITYRFMFPREVKDIIKERNLSPEIERFIFDTYRVCWMSPYEAEQYDADEHGRMTGVCRENLSDRLATAMGYPEDHKLTRVEKKGVKAVYDLFFGR